MVDLPGGHLVSHERTEEVYLHIYITLLLVSTFCDMSIKHNSGNEFWILISFTYQVNKALDELIKAAEAKTNLHDWTNLPEKSSGKQFNFEGMCFLARMTD